MYRTDGSVNRITDALGGDFVRTECVVSVLMGNEPLIVSREAFRASGEQQYILLHDASFAAVQLQIKQRVSKFLGTGGITDGLCSENIVERFIAWHRNNQRRLRRSGVSTNARRNGGVSLIPHLITIRVKDHLSISVAHNGAPRRRVHGARTQRLRRLLIEINTGLVAKIPDV